MRSGLMQRFLLFMKFNEQYVKILNFGLIAILFIHTSGCFWYFIGSFNPEKNWITEFGIEKESIYRKYVCSIYYVFTILVTVGYGNIKAVNLTELIFCILLMFIAVVIFSYIMGVMTYNFTKLNANDMHIR